MKRRQRQIERWSSAQRAVKAGCPVQTLQCNGIPTRLLATISAEPPSRADWFFGPGLCSKATSELR